MASNDTPTPTPTPNEPTDKENQSADATAPPKSAKQLAKEADKAEKLKRFQEKNEARAKAEEAVRLRLFSSTVDRTGFSLAEKGEGTGRRWSEEGRGGTRHHRIHVEHAARREERFVVDRFSSSIDPNRFLQIFAANCRKRTVRNTSRRRGIPGGTNKASFDRSITTSIRRRTPRILENRSPWSFRRRTSRVISIWVTPSCARWRTP